MDQRYHIFPFSQTFYSFLRGSVCTLLKCKILISQKNWECIFENRDAYDLLPPPLPTSILCHLWIVSPRTWLQKTVCLKLLPFFKQRIQLERHSLIFVWILCGEWDFASSLYLYLSRMHFQSLDIQLLPPQVITKNRNWYITFCWV